MKNFSTIFFALMVIVFCSFKINRSTQLTAVPDTSIELLLTSLGEPKSQHYIESVDPIKVKKGESLIKNGFAKEGIFRSKIISTYFTCVDCHSLNRESEDSRKTSPEDRLNYAIKTNQPFYPGSTFWGIYNRTSWYNGDYIKKYGDIISEARTSLSESIQVCAKYCSAGRFLEDWEVEAILHYFKSNELKLKDIQFDEQTQVLLNNANRNEKQQKELYNKLVNSFKRKEDASFLNPMSRDDRKYGQNGDPKRGEEIFDRSCLHCHFQGRVSHLKLDKDLLTAKWFVKNLKDYKDETLYQIIRYGTYTMAGRNQYMPLYTKEKMSDGQIEDLVAYIKQLANSNE
ncbi:MAG: cytochrome c [Bacteroidetes bacterium]|nr:cytochrome c [Bacteroidota bacterium]